MPGHSTDPTQWRHANPILEVADVPAAIAFYGRVFGLVPTWLTEEENIGGVTSADEPIEVYLERAERPTPSRLSVFVDDADATQAQCRAAGAEICEEIETKPWGMRRFTVRDPDGNLIDISHQVR